MANVATTTFKPVSRAVLRRVEAGNTATCAHCGEPVKFTAKTQRQQVIANVYTRRRTSPTARPWARPDRLLDRHPPEHRPGQVAQP
jgi:hypothetical protein